MISKLIDTNIFIRFLTKDNCRLSPQAKTIFIRAQQKKFNIYFDEIAAAEVIWLLDSFYEYSRTKICSQLKELFSQSWIINPRKNLILKSLDLFQTSNLSYVDCWLLVLNKDLKLPLETFDKKLKKLASS